MRHTLLDRLLRRAGASASEPPPAAAWEGLVEAIAQGFATADQDRCMLERSIEICSAEMQGLYQELQSRSESELAIERNRTAEGLGLALTKRLVDMHHGTIDVASRLGIGTTFTVHLRAA